MINSHGLEWSSGSEPAQTPRRGGMRDEEGRACSDRGRGEEMRDEQRSVCLDRRGVEAVKRGEGRGRRRRRPAG
jgi:hypothetical protein